MRTAALRTLKERGAERALPIISTENEAMLGLAQSLDYAPLHHVMTYARALESE